MDWMNWNTTAAEEMAELIDRESAKKNRIDSGFQFAAMGVVCHHCRRSMRYDEGTNTLLVCQHVFEEMKRQFPSDPIETTQRIPFPTIGGLSGVNVRVVPPALLREV